MAVAMTPGYVAPENTDHRNANRYEVTAVVEEWSDEGTEVDQAGFCGAFGADSSDEDKAGQWTHLHGAVPAYVRNNFIKKVYSILCVQLLVTFGISWGIMLVPVETLASIGWGNLIQMDMVLVLVLTFGMTCCCPQAMRRFPTNYMFLFLLTILMSGIVGTVCLAYETNAVLLSVALTAGIFISLTAFACLTKTDFTGLGPYLFAALSCLVLASVIGLFLRIDAFQMVLAGIGCALFSFYVVFDTQLIVGGSHKKYKFEVDDYCFAALTLYLDIINLFLNILRCLGGRSS